MKITLKTVILVALFIFYLVIILSNFAGYEGMKSEISDETDTPRETDIPRETDMPSETDMPRETTLPSGSVNLVKTVVKKSNTEDFTVELPEMRQ